MKKYLMILGGFTGILFLFTVIPSRFAAPASDTAEPPVATETATLPAETATSTTAEPAGRADLCESYQMLDITSGKVEELSVRDYVIGAVCAEMPATFEPEALKAQAVCARTYAWKQIQEQRLHGLEADVDDTVNFQVYGNMEPQKAATEAVRETEGQILCQNGEAVEAYYFSTSAGVTSTDEIWGSDEAAPYLRSVPCKFDEEEPWSSWIVDLPWKMLEDRIREKGEGTVLRSVTVTRRSESGAATALEAVSDKDSCIIENEYEIRKFLAPVNCMITEKDGTETAGGSLLPSAYFELERTQNGNLQVRGKGYGHGVGMSQTGADKMAEQGYDYREILDYFFRNITVENLG